jgi:phosphatidylethanolamine/phosphatidyl-N-methylethanolamine N-methyltransferase
MKNQNDRPQRMIENFYSGIGPIYNFIYGKLLFNDGRRVAIDFLNLKDHQKVLEVGVGTGLTLPMYPSTCKVEGIDLSESMLGQAHELVKHLRLKNVHLQKMNANSLGFEDDKFDAVLGNLFISATSDPVGALNEMKRVCKKGGMLVLMNHFRSENFLVSKLEDTLAPVAKNVLGFNSALSLYPLVDKVGLKVNEIKRVNLFGLWTAVSMVNEK